jgi:murein endopeptidase
MASIVNDGLWLPHIISSNASNDDDIDLVVVEKALTIKVCESAGVVRKLLGTHGFGARRVGKDDFI